MKQLILAAVAATLVFASAAQAAAPAKADQPANPTMTVMSAEDCTKAMAACADQACKDALVRDHGCVKAAD